MREGNKERDKKTVEGGSPGFVVMGDDSCLKVCWFKSRCHILDGYLDIFSH